MLCEVEETLGKVNKQLALYPERTILTFQAQSFEREKKNVEYFSVYWSNF